MLSALKSIGYDECRVVLGIIVGSNYLGIKVAKLANSRIENRNPSPPHTLPIFALHTLPILLTFYPVYHSTCLSFATFYDEKDKMIVTEH